MYEYKTVPAPKIIQATNNKQLSQEVRKFADLINEECSGGWEFVSIETLTVQEKPGCLSAFTKKEVTVSYNMIVFKREKKD